MVASDYGRMSLDGNIRHIDGYVGIDIDDGESILLQMRGRMSSRYGEGNSRLQILITAGRGPHQWLGERQAIGIGRSDNSRHIVEVYALVIPPEDGSPSPADHEFDGRLIFTRQSQHDENVRHRVIASEFGSRYLSVAGGGGTFVGPTIGGFYPTGYSWSPHRLSMVDGMYFMHHDVNSVIEADDGAPILMSYTGLNSRQTSARSWRSAVLFEAPSGPHAWLNEILAIGVGEYTGGGARYEVYDFD
jgi:hypothetical protein